MLLTDKVVSQYNAQSLDLDKYLWLPLMLDSIRKMQRTNTTAALRSKDINLRSVMQLNMVVYQWSSSWSKKCPPSQCHYSHWSRSWQCWRLDIAMVFKIVSQYVSHCVQSGRIITMHFVLREGDSLNDSLLSRSLAIRNENPSMSLPRCPVSSKGIAARNCLQVRLKVLKKFKMDHRPKTCNQAMVCTAVIAHNCQYCLMLSLHGLDRLRVTQH